MTDKLKPCPFCGGEAEVEQYGTPRQATVVSCRECSARLYSSETFGHGSAWNTRPGIDPPAVTAAKNAVVDAAGYVCTRNEWDHIDGAYELDAALCALDQLDAAEAAEGGK